MGADRSVTVLGIADSYTSGAAIVVDGRVVAAVNEERLDRNKMSNGFPRLSIAEVMDLAGVARGEVDTVAVATRSLFWRPQAEPLGDYFRKTKGGVRDALLGLASTLSDLPGDFRTG